MAKKNKKNGPSPKDKRPGLSRDSILMEAVKIADAEGLSKVSMRKVSASFAVEAMSLYHHVKNKDDILNGMIDLILGEIVFNRESSNWRDSMRERAISTREVLKAHPWALGVLESRPDPGPITLEYHDAVLKVLFDAGFSLALAAHAFSALDAYTYGFVMQEDALPFDNPEELQIVAAGILSSFPKGAYPHLKRLTLDHVLQPGYSYSKEFLFGLDLVLESIEARRAL